MSEGEGIPMDIRTLLKANPVIAATEQDQLAAAMASPVSAILLMYAKLTRLMEETETFTQAGKPIFVHT
ncbi:hypothetical protein, partial [Lactiplantibacillus plantarum]